MFKFPMIHRKIVALAAIGVDIKIGRNVHFNRFALRMRAGDRLTIGDESIIEASLRTDRSPAEIDIGMRTFISRGSTLIAAEKVTVGDDVLISWNVVVVDHDSHAVQFSQRRDDVVAWGKGRKNWEHVRTAPVKICNKAWIGFGASVLKGVNVGEGAVVAAQSVVTRDVEPWTIVAGNPARVIRQLKPES